MVRSPLSRDQDETPLTPTGEKPEPEDHHLNKISFGRSARSEIPQNEIGYYPVDSGDGRLFTRKNCDCYHCDCDFTSEGFLGCLRRNRQCIFTAIVLLLTTSIILVIFNSLSQNHAGKYEEVFEAPSWRYSYNESISEEISEKAVQAPVIEDSPEPYLEYVPGFKKVFENRDDENILERKKRETEGSSILNTKSNYQKVMEELNEIEKSMMNRFRETARTVFEPFSLSEPTTPGWTESDSGSIDWDEYDTVVGSTTAAEVTTSEPHKGTSQPDMSGSAVGKDFSGNEKIMQHWVGGFDSSYAVPEKTINEANTLGISLSDAKKRKEQNRKHQLLNSRIVSGLNDVQFPTAPDEEKPEMNTVETVKTSQQLSFTPSGLAQYLLPYQLCFYGNIPFRGKNSPRDVSPKTLSLFNPPLLKLPSDERKTPFHFPTQQNILSFNINNYANPAANHYPPTAGSIYSFPSPQHFPHVLNGAAQLQEQPLFCTYLQPPLIQFPTLQGMSEFHPKNADDGNSESSREVTVLADGVSCLDNTVSCRDGSMCIHLDNWCDNKVHCRDASDEVYCSCRERLSLERLCDGYPDCPHGEDEVGCFDCPKSTFSCDTFDKPRACIPLSKRCDGIRDCPTGKDEVDCTALYPHVHVNESYQVSYSRGFLHRNWKGDWYPVCVEIDSNLWANEACAAELGVIIREPEISLAAVSGGYKGPFLARRGDGTILLQEHCKGHVSTYVNCPEPQCGTRITSTDYAENRFKRYVHEETPDWWERIKRDIKRKYHVEDVYWKFRPVEEGDSSKARRDETGRVVGGKESEPRAWPWAVALYMNGDFHCGGVILDEEWVLTAAHCVDQYWKNYYEIRSGMLRRFSYSPMEQIRTVSHVIVHEKYNKSVMNNDLALLKLQRPLVFNRWVRPTCLPGVYDGDFWGPAPGSRCIAIGWGAVKERGANPDQMREVEVPILPKCRHVEDLAGNEICAGLPEGGKDTCQGDSGGPLLCRDSRTFWYVAGIVSHGEGCARPGEPGAYTRVSLYMDWIAANANNFQLPVSKPSTECPGFRCKSGSKRCISQKWVCNGFTDCLNGEDELKCSGGDRPKGKFVFTGELLRKVEEPKNKTRRPSQRSLPGVTETTSYIASVPDLHVHQEVEEGLKTVSFEEFQCQTITQRVHLKLRCDGKVDCEDGSDEAGCTCRDRLLQTRPELICDGIYDCQDLTDEWHCRICKKEEFSCGSSGSCVARSKQCDGKVDCTAGEDEENCRALSKNGKVSLDVVGRPFLKLEGRLMARKGDGWRMFCQLENAQKTAMEVCSSFGSSGYESYENGSDSTPGCATLNVTCSRRLTTNLENYGRMGDAFRFPWHAIIYSDGVEICAAALIERKWLITSIHCVNGVKLDENHVVAKLGTRRADLTEIIEFGTQIIRIDGIVPIRDSDIAMLQLSRKASETREVRPLTLPYWFEMNSSREECVAVEEETIFLKSLSNCPELTRCFKRTNGCRLSGRKAWSGVVACRSQLGWYPASVYHEHGGLCRHDHYVLRNLIEKLKSIKSITESEVQSFPEVFCDGVRCREGRCISGGRVCDGIPDCPTAEDEDPNICTDSRYQTTGCRVDEMVCKSGSCVKKSRFGDGKVDCDDGSDEPNLPKCVDYLNVTAPARICDGNPNCQDKSDESFELCGCNDSKFNCTSSRDACVPQEFVCDGDRDCPNGEDEASCVGYRLLSTQNRKKEVEIIHMSYGIWHSLCWSHISDQQAEEICRELGSETAIKKYMKNQTRISPVLDPYSDVKLNKEVSLSLRGDRPRVKIEENGHCEVIVVLCE